MLVFECGLVKIVHPTKVNSLSIYDGTFLPNPSQVCPILDLGPDAVFLIWNAELVMVWTNVDIA